MDRYRKYLEVGAWVFANVGLAGVIAYGLGFAYAQGYYDYFHVGLDEAGVSRLSLVSPLALLFLVTVLPVLFFFVMVGVGAYLSRLLDSWKTWLSVVVAIIILLALCVIVRNTATNVLALLLTFALVPAFAAMALIDIRNSPRPDGTARRSRPRTLPAILLAGMGVTILTVALVVLQGVGSADAATVAKAAQQNRPPLSAWLIPSQAQPVDVEWFGRNPAQVAASDAFLYMGESGGVTILFDYRLHKVLRIPSSDLLLTSKKVG